MRKPKLNKYIIEALRKKMKGSDRVADSYTIPDPNNRYAPRTVLKFSKKDGILYVSMYKRKSVYRNFKRGVQVSKYMGKFKVCELLNSCKSSTSKSSISKSSTRKSRKYRRSRKSRKHRRSRKSRKHRRSRKSRKHRRSRK